MYYALIFVSVFMFGGTFALKDVYRSKVGAGLKVSIQFSLMTAIPGLIALFLINGFKLEFTWFTFIMAIIHSLSGFAMTFCGFRALERINLSLYSLFMMLGGMVLPYFQGIMFYDEPITGAKIVCFILVCAALALTVDYKNVLPDSVLNWFAKLKGSVSGSENEENSASKKSSCEGGEKSEEPSAKSKKRGGFIYYFVIFVLNGMSGVMSKYFTEAPFEKTSAAGYSILSAITSISMALILMLFMMNKGPKIKHTPVTVTIAASNGILNRIANYILVITLANGVESSIQYSIVTGGVIAVSTAVAFLKPNKPKMLEIISSIIACLGIAALLLPF